MRIVRGVTWSRHRIPVCKWWERRLNKLKVVFQVRLRSRERT